MLSHGLRGRTPFALRAPVKQLPRVRARSLVALRRPNAAHALRSSALAEGGGTAAVQQPAGIVLFEWIFGVLSLWRALRAREQLLI